MSVSFENKETNRGLLTFSISQEKIKPALDRVFNSVKKDIAVPGFRKGRLPRAIFNQRFGEEALYQDALNALLPEAYEAAVKEAGIEVVAQPQFDVESMEKGQDWVIKAEVVTKPEVKLGAYKDLEVTVEATKEVTDAEVDERIEREDKGALQSGASCRGNRLRLVATSSIYPRLLRWLSCRFLQIRLVETEIRCIFASEIFRESSREVNGSVAQLNRASDYGSEGYRFESCRGHHKKKRRTTTR